MLNRTYNLDKSDKSTHVKVDARNEQLSIQKTEPNSKITCLKIDSDAFNLMMGEEPFLISETETVKGEPFRNCHGNSLYPYSREVKDYYTHGVTILQIQRNGEHAFIEYKDRECEPKLFATHFEDLTTKEVERILNEQNG